MKSKALFPQRESVFGWGRGLTESAPVCFPTVLPIPTVASPQEECLFGIIAYEYYVRQEAASLFKGPQHLKSCRPQTAS